MCDSNRIAHRGCIVSPFMAFFYRDVFLWYRGGLSLLFGIELFFLVSRFCILLFSIYIVVLLGSTCACFFGPRLPVNWRLKKISILRRRSKNLDTPKKTSRYQLKESPLENWCPARKLKNVEEFFSKQGSTPTPWARGLRDRIQKWAPLSPENHLFIGFSVLRV